MRRPEPPPLIADAVRHAIVAAQCRRAALDDPKAAKGLTKCADDHAATASELLALAVADHVMGD